MTCCVPSTSLHGTNKFFSKHADKYIRQFRKKGLAKEQRQLITGIERSSLSGKSILEIGCGVGGLHLTLVKRGASRAVGIDISDRMIEEARQLSKELGFDGRTEYLVGDVAQMNGQVGGADIVILDKVVCCYEELDRLMMAAFSKTKQTIALTFPNPNILVRISFFGLILLGKTLRWSFHPYWHDWDKLVQTIQKSGFQTTFQDSTLFWAVYVFDKSS